MKANHSVQLSGRVAIQSTAIVHLHLKTIPDEGSATRSVYTAAQALFSPDVPSSDQVVPQLIYREVAFDLPQTNEAGTIHANTQAKNWRNHCSAINAMVKDLREWDGQNDDYTIRRIILFVSTHSDDDSGRLFIATNLSDNIRGVSTTSLDLFPIDIAYTSPTVC